MKHVTNVVPSLLVSLALVHATEPPKVLGPPDPVSVATISLEWRDAARDRMMPVKIYYPQAGNGPFPVIIFSHGLGGTREGYAYLGRHWAGHGYVAVHLQHAGSDDAAWRGQLRPLQSMREAAAQVQNAVDRPLDVRFALDQVLRLNGEAGVFQGRLDTNRLGVAGHSFGAYTTLAVAGQLVGPARRTLADDRVKAAIAMSAPVPRRNAAAAYSQIRIPVLHMTGTEDNSPIGDTTARERRIPFDHVAGNDQYLLTFTGGDHMVFSGRNGWRGDRSHDAVFQELICRSSTAFWDAYLKGDAKAKAWLAEGGFENVLGREGLWEKKLSPQAQSAPARSGE